MTEMYFKIDRLRRLYYVISSREHYSPIVYYSSTTLSLESDFEVFSVKFGSIASKLPELVTPMRGPPGLSGKNH